VYTNGDEAELFLNGKSLGRRQKSTAPSKTGEGLAHRCKATASSKEADKQNWVFHGNDGDPDTRWCAADENPDQWWQVDLGTVQRVQSCVIRWEKPADHYQYRIRASSDGRQWVTVMEKTDFSGRGHTSVHNMDVRARYLRIEFTRLKDNWASFYEFSVFSEPRDPVKDELPTYYKVIDRYRLRWENVIYEPGDVKAVAYRRGKKVGEAVMRTAGTPAGLRLTPDRQILAATGDDLCYILVEAIDRDGRPCPLAEHPVTFAVEGPGEIAGAGNGDPTATDSLVDDRHRLFFGKAMLILRTLENRPGPIRVTARSDGLDPVAVEVRAENIP
jgi:hypothetical protein